MKKYIIMLAIITLLLLSVMSCNSSKLPMTITEVEIYQEIETGNLNISFVNSYDNMSIMMSAVEGQWVEISEGDTQIYFEYHEASNKLVHPRLTLDMGEYNFKFKYISKDGNGYEDSSVYTSSFRLRQPQSISAENGYFSIIYSQESFNAMFNINGVIDFEQTSQYESTSITYNKCLIAEFGEEDDMYTVQIKHLDESIGYNNNLEMALFKASHSFYEPIADWRDATADNYLSYLPNNQYEVRLVVRIKGNDDYLPSDQLVAIIDGDGIINEDRMQNYANLIYNSSWTISFPWINYNDTSEILRNIYKADILSEMSSAGITGEYVKVLSSESETIEVGEESYYFHGYIYEFANSADATLFYNYKTSNGRNVAVNGKYVAEVRKYINSEYSGDNDDTNFFTIIGFTS